ncbi:MAG: FtsW/RodA/SpoVE family cell cycle protein, partial [Candidatus Binatia bacterium]
MVAIIEKRDLRDFDWLTTLLAVAIASFGVWQIHNALPTESYWSKQIIGLVIAFIAFLFVAFSDYRRIIDAAPIFYGLGLVLLLLVLTPLGHASHGQKAWVVLPLIGQFQPSEFVKIPTVLMLAKYYGAKKGNALTLKEFLIGGAILGGPVALIMLEPDAGQAITYFPILAAVWLLSAIKIRYVIAMLLAIVILVPAGWILGVKAGVIKFYQQERINAIIDPESVDPRGFGY